MADVRVQDLPEVVSASPTDYLIIDNGVVTSRIQRKYLGDQMIFNLKPAVGSNNVLNLYTKTGGAVQDAGNPLQMAIPDGNGYTIRTRASSYLSGTSIFTMADAANYWSKGSANGEIKEAFIYAIWDGTGVVFALAGYSGFNMVPTTTTVTDDDYFLLEGSSSYTRSNSHYCVCIGRIRYTYYTGDSPDHTILTTVENAPQVIWNPPSNYGYSKTLATSIAQSSNITDSSHISLVVKQTGKYIIGGQALISATGPNLIGVVYLKTGSATYGSASQRAVASVGSPSSGVVFSEAFTPVIVRLSNGDTVHFGGSVVADSGTRTFSGDDNQQGGTQLTFHRI